MRSIREHVLLFILLAVVAPLAVAQSLSRADSHSTALDSSAAIVFRGTVLRIARLQTQDSEPATVLISFRVDEAVRGCVAGETVEIREWAGLWARSDRYRAGQKLLLRLYSPSDLGLTSTVALEASSISGDNVPSTTISNSPRSSQPGPHPINAESDSPRARLRSLPAKLRDLQIEDLE